MTFETWIAFVFASAIVVLIPGPNVIVTVTYAIRDGRRTGLATVPGVVAGAFVAMTLSLAGIGAFLAASALWFTLLKAAGALYLLWLGITLWRAPAQEVQLEGSYYDRPLSALFWRTFLISLLNPKSPAFFMAFVPQFMSPEAPILPQFAILISSFLAVATLNSLLWLFLASALRDHFKSAHAMRALNRAGGGCLMAAGAVTLRATRLA